MAVVSGRRISRGDVTGFIINEENGRPACRPRHDFPPFPVDVSLGTNFYFHVSYFGFLFSSSLRRAFVFCC